MLVRFGIGAHELRPLYKGCGRPAQIIARQQQHHARIIKPQRKLPYLARGRRHIPIEILAQPIAGIHIKVLKRPVTEQANGIFLSLRSKIRHRLLPCPAAFDNRLIAQHNLMHSLLNSLHQRCRQAYAIYIHIYAVADAVLHLHRCAGTNIPQRQQQNQPRASFVNAPRLLMFKHVILSF